MSYQYVCEPCRQLLNLDADAAYLNHVKRERGGFNTSRESTARKRREVFDRDEAGKPILMGYRMEDQIVATNSLCACACTANDHDAHRCTGEDDFRIGGRPGSGFVDAKTTQFGMEPSPEMVASMNEEVAATVRVMLAWLKGESEHERLEIEKELEKQRYSEQQLELRDLLVAKLPHDLVTTAYKNLKPDLKKLAAFRDEKVAHSWPVSGDWSTRVKRSAGRWISYTLSTEEIAEHLDLAMKLLSQLSFIPLYINRFERDQERR